MTKIETLDQLLDHILYGDIEEVPLSVLGDKTPADANRLDEEQYIRVCVAATIRAYQLGRLGTGGHLIGDAEASAERSEA